MIEEVTPLRNRPLLMLAAGHFTVDMYSGMMPILFPEFREAFDLNLGTVGLVALAYIGMASISQPAFGMIADRYGTRLTGVAQVWTACLFACIGFAPSFPALLVIAGLAGLGSGWFHPFGALNASAVIGSTHRNTAMSIYIAGGTLGVALGPLIAAGLVTLFGLRGLVIAAIPGILIGTWLLRSMREIAVKGRGGRFEGGQVAVPYGVLAIVVGVMMSRQVPTIGVENFIPTWYKELGYGAGFYSALATTLVLSTAIGALGVGTLADRFGRRAVMLGTMMLTVPAVWAFTEFPGPWGFASGALIGVLAASTSPILLVMAQQLMRGRAGAASGMILGLGFISGGIATPVLGAIADRCSIETALHVLVGVVIASIVIAWFLPHEERMAELQRA